MHVSIEDEIGELLSRVKIIAVVGLSSDAMRASYGVSQYMQSRGYRIIPVNPNEQMVLGERSYASLAAVPAKMIWSMSFVAQNMFRRSWMRPFA